MLAVAAGVAIAVVAVAVAVVAVVAVIVAVVVAVAVAIARQFHFRNYHTAASKTMLVSQEPASCYATACTQWAAASTEEAVFVCL